MQVCRNAGWRRSFHSLWWRRYSTASPAMPWPSGYGRAGSHPDSVRRVSGQRPDFRTAGDRHRPLDRSEATMGCSRSRACAQLGHPRGCLCDVCPACRPQVPCSPRRSAIWLQGLALSGPCRFWVSNSGWVWAAMVLMFVGLFLVRPRGWGLEDGAGGRQDGAGGG